MIFLGAATKEDLASVPKLKKKLDPSGALWIVRPKGAPAITERDVMAAGKEAGLVDVKVASVSPTHSGAQVRDPRRPIDRTRRVLDADRALERRSFAAGAAQ